MSALTISAGVLIAFAALFNAIMDVSSIDGFNNPWWNKSTGWHYKWKNGDPKEGERFFLSSTVLVFLTDGWHLAQFLFHSCWQLLIVIALGCNWWETLLGFFMLKGSFSLSFEILYRRLKKWKKD